MGSSTFTEIATISTVPCMEINNVSVEWLAVLKLCILTTVFKEFCCCVPVKNISWKESYITWKWAYCITHIKNFNQKQKTEGRVSFTCVNKYKDKYKDVICRTSWQKRSVVQKHLSKQCLTPQSFIIISLFTSSTFQNRKSKKQWCTD